MMNTGETQASLIVMFLSILLVVFAYTILHFRNPQIEAKCMANGGQILVTPGRISSCLYPAK